MRKEPIGIIVLILIIAAAGWLFYSQSQRAGQADQSGQPVPSMPDGSGSMSELPVGTTTVRGTFICLPHKDASGPQTMECAYGMKADDGNNYAIDWSATPTSAFDLPMGREYAVTGTIVPVEALSSDHWRVYDIRGIIRASSYEEAASGTPSLPASTTTVTLELNKPVNVGATSLKVGAVLEDSRCPSDVTCIQAGRAVVVVSAVSPSGTSTALQIQQGKTVTTETMAITLDKVTPYPVSTHKTADSEYRFVFTLRPR